MALLHPYIMPQTSQIASSVMFYPWLMQPQSGPTSPSASLSQLWALGALNLSAKTLPGMPDSSVCPFAPIWALRQHLSGLPGPLVSFPGTLWDASPFSLSPWTLLVLHFPTHSLVPSYSKQVTGMRLLPAPH